MKRASAAIILFLILILGIALRIYDLDGESIWYDEGDSVYLARMTPFQVIMNPSSHDHPPLYYFLMHRWIKAFGDSVFSMRLPSAIFGILSIFMIYAVGRSIFDEKVSLLSAAILALSPFHIHYSQELRMYTIVTFLALVSMYFFLRLIKRSSFRDSVVYIISTVLLLYTHYSSFFIILIQNIYFIIMYFSLKERGGISFLKWLLRQLILIISYLPWLMVLMLQIAKMENMGSGGRPASMPSTLYLFIEFAGGGFALAILAGLVIFSLFKIKMSKKGLLLSMWLFGPIIVIFIAASSSGIAYATRYTIAMSLAFYILAARGLAGINYKYIRQGLIAVVIGLLLLSCFKYYSNVNKVAWYDIGNYIDKTAEKGDLLLINCKGCRKYIIDYYLKKGGLVKRMLPGTIGYAPVHINEKNVKEVRLMAEDYARVWVFLSHDYDFKKLIRREFEGSHNLLYYKLYPSYSYTTHKIKDGTEVFLFEKNTEEAR